MNSNADRRCSKCNNKTNGCTAWYDKKETTLSGWDKNRFATCCLEYEEKGNENENRVNRC